MVELTILNKYTFPIIEWIGTPHPDFHKYRKWILDTDPEIARQAFVAEYGVEPAEMVIYKQLLLVGPVPEV